MKKHHLMTFWTLAIASGAMLIQGCATSPSQKNMVWYNPDRSPGQIIADEAECRNMVRINRQGVPMDEGAATILGLLGEDKREKDIYSDCMIAKGYTLVSTNSPLLVEKPTAIGANKAAESDLIGDWQSIAFKGEEIGNGVSKFHFSFLADGSIVLTTIQNEKVFTQSGKYIVQGNALVITDANNIQDRTLFSIIGDDLVLTHENGGTQIILQKANQINQ